MRRRHSSEPATGAGPHRGFVLALCGGGILALAIGGAVALYAWVTALFGSPIANWSQVVHSGLSTGIIGAILVAIYLPIAFRERLFSGTPKQITPTTPAPDTATTPVPVAPVTIEAILDELLIGKITRDEAATRIRALDKSTTGA